jgi:YidC/Oxa1 family membrane protein insertase
VSGITNAVTSFFGDILRFLHDLVAQVGFLEAAAWGWAIILLTLIVRIALLPLAIKQTRSMRAMTALQPQMKEIQKKYKVDRELMRKDPETYKAKKQKLNEEMMALYQREGVNPAASCLPLLAQAPIFLALFWTLRDYDPLIGAEFYFFTAVGEGGLEQLVSQAGWPGWLLIVLMSGTMFISQKQMMARNASQMADNPMAQQQKILLYVMPVFLAVISFNFPMGILLYWVTTNFWQVAQQWIILREVQHEVETGELGEHPGGEAAKRTDAKGNGKAGKKGKGKGAAGAKPSSGSTPPPPKRSKGASSGKTPIPETPEPSPNGDHAARQEPGDAAAEQPPPGPPPATPRARDHLPRRRGRGDSQPGGQA